MPDLDDQVRVCDGYGIDIPQVAAAHEELHFLGVVLAHKGGRPLEVAFHAYVAVLHLSDYNRLTSKERPLKQSIRRILLLVRLPNLAHVQPQLVSHLVAYKFSARARVRLAGRHYVAAY